eukprot:Sdes_comp24766_c0_seq1m22520
MISFHFQSFSPVILCIVLASYGLPSVSHTIFAQALPQNFSPLEVPRSQFKYIPVIGILTKPLWDDYGKDNGTATIPAEYVSWISSGGARVVPIHYDSPKEILSEMFH